MEKAHVRTVNREMFRIFVAVVAVVVVVVVVVRGNGRRRLLGVVVRVCSRHRCSRGRHGSRLMGRKWVWLAAGHLTNQTHDRFFKSRLLWLLSQ